MANRLDVEQIGTGRDFVLLHSLLSDRSAFDRIIAAQALALDIPVISLDAKLDQFGVRRIW